MFRRRTPRTYASLLRQALWPRGGWARAAAYVKHRLRRLPDPPERIGRGVAAGVFISFTPLFGLHFIASALLAKAVRGNIVAALLGTFTGNPLTFPIIAVVSLGIGDWLLGTSRDGKRAVWVAVSDAWADVRANLRALFTGEEAHWTGVEAFFADVFVPYTVGGMLPGTIAALAAYALMVPAVAAYQRHRRSLATRRLKRLAGQTARKAAPRGSRA